MIQVKNLVPEIYYNDSRDFQFIGRLFEIGFNNVKTGVDSLLNNPWNKNLDDKLVDLLAKTVGFDTKHRYTVKDLKVVCSCFKEIMMKKGSKEAIEILVRALLKAQNISKQYLIEVFTTKEALPNEEIPTYFEPYSVIIEVPYELNDTVLIEDVLDYILPSGCDYRIIRAIVTNLSSDPQLIKTSSDNIYSEEIELIQESGEGAAQLYSNIEVATIKG